MFKVYPLGYSINGALVETLMQQENMLLIDSRKSPNSKVPGFSGDELKEKYKAKYRFAGNYLGNVNAWNGLPIKLVNPVVGIAGLVKYLSEGKDLIILCGCASHEQCHRKAIIDLLKGAMPSVEVIMPDDIKQEGTMRTISIMQPWHWIIMNGDLLQEHGIPPKVIENRQWTTKYRGLVFLRAGSFDNEFFEKGKLASSLVWHAFSRMIGDEDARKLYGLMPKSQSEYLSGGIAGRCNIVDVLDWHDDGDWKCWEQYGLVLSDIEPLPFVATKGAFKLFNTSVCHCCSLPVNDGNSELVGDKHKQYRLCTDCIK